MKSRDELVAGNDAFLKTGLREAKSWPQRVVGQFRASWEEDTRVGQRNLVYRAIGATAAALFRTGLNSLDVMEVHTRAAESGERVYERERDGITQAVPQSEIDAAVQRAPEEN